jgi:hypothetical protein
LYQQVENPHIMAHVPVPRVIFLFSCLKKGSENYAVVEEDSKIHRAPYIICTDSNRKRLFGDNDRRDGVKIQQIEEAIKVIKRAAAAKSYP